MVDSRRSSKICVVVSGVLIFVAASSSQVEELCANTDTTKYCLLRDRYYPQELWNHFAGFYCYNYTNDARLHYKYNYTSQNVLWRSELTKVPVAIIDNTTTAVYDYKNSTAVTYILRSFKSEALFNNFLTCCREAENCCSDHMTNENIVTNDTHCPAVWDAWSCFPPTHVNTTASITCSSQAYQSPDHVCRLESEKKCLWNNKTHNPEWVQQTDYSVCAIAPVYRKRYSYHVAFLGVCIAFCLPAIAIFLVFEKLRKTIRVVLHRNLLMAICLRNVFTMMSKKLVLLDALKSSVDSRHTMDNNGIECRILAFLETSSINCIYGCMLLDGFYLHKVIVRAFAKEVNMLFVYIVLIALTFSSSVCWAIAMAFHHAENCWMVDIDNLQWILDGFRIAVLVINTLLLLDILRVMLMKLKNGSTTRQTRAAFRATLFLIPLFGLHIIITAKKWVYNDTCIAEDVYDYFRYSLEPMQGIMVALLFCYGNTEVQNEVKNCYRKWTIQLNQKYGWNIGANVVQYRRRTTANTIVHGLSYPNPSLTK